MGGQVERPRLRTSADADALIKRTARFVNTPHKPTRQDLERFAIVMAMRAVLSESWQILAMQETRDTDPDKSAADLFFKGEAIHAQRVVRVIEEQFEQFMPDD